MNVSHTWKKMRLALLLSIVVVTGLASTGCIGGITSVGWSGVVIDDGTLFTGSREGVLVSVDTSDGSRLKSEALTGQARTGLFGCSSVYGGGCGGGTTAIAIYGTPTVAGELVYLAGYNGRVYAYNRDNLAVRWVYPRDTYGKPMVAGPVVYDGLVLIGDSEGVFRALDAETGDEVWSFTEEDKDKQERIWGTASVADDTVYFGSFNETLYALNVQTGSVKWTFNANGAVVATPLIIGDVIYVGAFDKKLYALNAGDGSIRWEFTAGNWFWAQPVLVGDTLYAADLDGNAYAIDANSGIKKSEYFLDYGVAANPVATDRLVVFANREGVIYTIDTQTGEKKLLVNLEVTVNGPLAIKDNIIYLQTDTYEIAMVNVDSGAVLQPYVIGG